MNLVIGPTYTMAGTSTGAFAGMPGVLMSVIEAPIAFTYFGDALTGDPIVFDAGAEPWILPVPIPRLAGLDAIEVGHAGFRIASAAYLRRQSVAATAPSGGAVTVSLTGAAAGQAVALQLLAVTGLVVPPSGATNYALRGDNQTVYWTVDAGSGDVVSQTSAPTGTIHHLHVLIRPRVGGANGPPSAAVPAFAMPGAGSSLYGPALGGASLNVQRRSGGRIDLAIDLAPAQPMSACQVFIGTAAKGSPHEGLPNEVAAVTWTADSIEGTFDLRPAGITITAHAGSMDPADGALVAQFDTDPGAAPLDVDFAPVCRALLTDSYPTSQGADLGLALRVAVAAPCALRLQLESVAIRYVHRPLAGGAAPALRGAAETIQVPVPASLRPQGASFRLDGRYGPARLVNAADDATAASRQGFRVAGACRIARRLGLSPKERTLPLARIGVFGRASEDGELLISRHGGSVPRIGARIGAPLSLPIGAAPAPAWHRVEIMAADALPPHPDAIWIVVEATKGVFWWHADLDDAPADPTESLAQRSTDSGATWSHLGGRPLLHAWVTEIDPATGEPAPVLPLSLAWDDGVLNADVVGVAASPGAEFTRLWVAEGAAHGAFLDGIADLDSGLGLHLACRRDVDLSISDLVLTYDPWTAGAV